MPNFNYLEQFEDIEIDFSKYLKYISNTGKTKYTFSTSQETKTKIKNLFTKFEIKNNFTGNLNAFSLYKIEDYEFPEHVSFKFYQTVDFWWIILIFNDIKNPFLEWPLPDEYINELAKILHKNENKYSFETYLKFLSENNEKKRKIIVPKEYIIPDIIWAYKEALRNK